MVPPAAPVTFRFGDFLLDPGSRTLHHSSSRQPIPLTSRPFDTLLYLLQSGGRVVTRQEILHAVWQQVNVHPNSVEHAIAGIRQALGDTREHPRFIQTVHGVGYRILMPVSQAPPRATLHRWHLAAAGAALILTVALGARYRFAATRPSLSDVVPLTQTGYPKLGRPVAVGDWLYFSERGPSGIGIRRLPRAGGPVEAVPIPLPDPEILDYHPAPPRLLVRSRDDLWLVPATSGAPVRLLTSITGAAAFSPNGFTVAFVRGDSLLVHSLDSTTRPLCKVNGRPDWPRWNPDGSRIRFTLRSAEGIESLWEVSPSSGGARRLPLEPESEAQACCGDWIAGGNWFAFESLHRGQRSLWAVQNGGKPVRLTMPPENYRFPISGPRASFYAWSDPGRSEAVRLLAGAEHHHPLLGGVAVQGFALSAATGLAAWIKRPDQSLWQSNPDGSKPVLLTASGETAFPRWAPDGRAVAAWLLPLGRPWALVVIPAGGGPQRLLPIPGGFPSSVSWARDGARILVAASDGLRESDLSGNSVLLQASKDLTSPAASPRDDVLLAVRSSTHQLLARESPGVWRSPTDRPAACPTWSSTGDAVFFADPTQPGLAVYRLDWPPRNPPQLVFQAPDPRLPPCFETGSPGAFFTLRNAALPELHLLDFSL